MVGVPQKCAFTALIIVILEAVWEHSNSVQTSFAPGNKHHLVKIISHEK